MPENKETKSGLSQSKIERQLPPKLFPVVGLGASAGGLEALKAFFKKVPPASGMAFIVLVHMTPNQPSLCRNCFKKQH